ncbi:hypothetical protein PTKIN_Ptkin01aG0077600 [Pterospermum kingtungense]
MLIITLSVGVSDDIYWGVTNSGQFSVKSAYDLVAGNESVLVDGLWKNISSLKIPNRMCSLLWLLKHKRLMCNAEHMRRGFIPQGNCALCLDDFEDVDHLFRFCPQSAAIWSHLLPPSEFQSQSTLDFEAWLQYNIKLTSLGELNWDWKVLFATTIWWIWRWRNDRVFNNVEYSLDFKISWIKAKAREVMVATSLDVRVPSDAQEYISKLVGWLPPPNGWITVNTDGCCKNNFSVAGCGGVLWDSNGEWIQGFSHNIGGCNVLAAKLWGAIIGLEVAWDTGHRQVQLEMDSMLAVCVKHIYREGNRVADFLASAAVQHEIGLVMHPFPHPGVQSFVADDRRGVSWARRVPVGND